MDMNTAFDLEELRHCPLALVYLLKTKLKEIWFSLSVREGARRWYRMALES